MTSLSIIELSNTRIIWPKLRIYPSNIECMLTQLICN